ncbi:MAG: TauD/TfdA family dioxygenase [Burkholderiales bacterium]|nr:TauD/TfdA family dioxygenase [Burkholderiales bacterium]
MTMENNTLNEKALKSNIKFTMVSPVLGANVECGSVASLSDSEISTIRNGLLENMVLLFRNQKLSDPELIQFGKRLGELDIAPFGYTNNQKERQYEEMVIISNVKEGGVPIGVLGDAEVVWHSDNSYRENPLSFSLLYSVELPDSGGETGFSNMYLAYEALPADIKSKIQNLVIKHDITYNSAGDLRRGFKDSSDPVTAPGPYHPIVRTHPETGYNALYLGRRPNAYICGLSVEESESLLNMLWTHATQDRFTWHHSWKIGDLLIWDNRCLMHRRNPFNPKARRVMHRLQFAGTRPYYDPRALTRGRHPRSVG